MFIPSLPTIVSDEYASHNQQQIRVAAATSIIAIAGGTEVERRCLRDALIPLLSSATAALRDVASTCLEKSLAHDLISDECYHQVFLLLENEDPRLRMTMISEFQHHIQISGEADHRKLVNAGVLSHILRICGTGKDDLISFTADCVLPVLGPSFTQSDGAASVIPLLMHDDHRIRGAAALSIRKAIESRHSNLQNIANSRILSTLHPMMAEITIRDLWCFVLPKIAPFLRRPDEVGLLFDYLRCELSFSLIRFLIIARLSHRHDVVRRTAAEAIRIMATTSNETRLILFPAVFPRLDGPPASSLQSIALGTLTLVN
jgi:hypothetical protein